jgi:hypothetical protein
MQEAPGGPEAGGKSRGGRSGPQSHRDPTRVELQCKGNKHSTARAEGEFMGMGGGNDQSAFYVLRFTATAVDGCVWKCCVRGCLRSTIDCLLITINFLAALALTATAPCVTIR